MIDKDFNGGFVPFAVCDSPFPTAIAPFTPSPVQGRDEPYYDFSSVRNQDQWNSDLASPSSGEEPYYLFSSASRDEEFPYYFGGSANTVLSADGLPYYLFGATPPFAEECAAPQGAGLRLPTRRAPGEPLRVTHVGPHLMFGGAEQWLLELVAGLDPRRMQVERQVVVTDERVDVDFASRLAGAGISVEVGNAESIRAAARKADVLFSWGLPLDRYLRGRPRPLSIQVVHGDGQWNRRFLEGSCHSVDHFVAVGHRVRRLVCHDVPSSVIYNGIDSRRLARTRRAEDTRRDLGFALDDVVVCFCGRLAAEKRIDCIVEAMAPLPERVKLLVVGTGSLETELRSLVAARLPGRAVFTSAQGTVGDLYAASDVFCLASSQEGCSLALLEAMLSGLAVVSTPVGNAAEVILDKVTGLLFDGSVAGLTRSLRMLVDHPEWRSGLAAEGRRLAERFGYARRMATDYANLVDSLLEAQAA
jgi:glycosyltransferase involved in cell wall biosynthesis